MSQVTINLHTIYQIPTPNGMQSKIQIEIAEEQTLGSLVEKLGIKMDMDSTLLVVNGKVVELSHRIYEGDTIHLIPAISGGSMGNQNGN